MATQDKDDEPTHEALLQSYALGTVSWTKLRESGLDNYADVLAGLGVLGLRPPIAEMTGPNKGSRQRGRSMVRAILANTAS